MNTFANPMGLFTRISRWKETRQAKRAGIKPSLYEDSISLLPEHERRNILDIISREHGSVPGDTEYIIMRRHIEENPELIEFLGADNPKDAADQLLYIAYDEDRFKKFFDELWEQSDEYHERYPFYRLWDALEVQMNSFIRKEHLIECPPEFFVQWASIRYNWDRLTYFIHSSMEIGKSADDALPLNLNDNLDQFWQSPFGKTVIRALNENQFFKRLIGDLMGLIDEGVRQPHTEKGRILEDMLTTGQRERGTPYYIFGHGIRFIGSTSFQIENPSRLSSIGRR